jgi:hypothetical protein
MNPHPEDDPAINVRIKPACRIRVFHIYIKDFPESTKQQEV